MGGTVTAVAAVLAEVPPQPPDRVGTIVVAVITGVVAIVVAWVGARRNTGPSTPPPPASPLQPGVVDLAVHEYRLGEVEEQLDRHDRRFDGIDRQLVDLGRLYEELLNQQTGGDRT